MPSVRTLIPSLTLAALAAGLMGCQERADGVAAAPTQVQSVAVSSAGQLLRFDLEPAALRWAYRSKQDAEGNRNRFAQQAGILYLPFESGKLVAFDAATGEIRWTQYANVGGGASDAVMDGDGETLIDPQGRPYYLSQPLVAGEFVYIATAGPPQFAQPQLQVLQRSDGALAGSDGIQTSYNLFAPVACREHVFVNSAIYLRKYSLRGSATSYGLHDEAAFEAPLYAQMQCDGKALYLGDERGRFYALPLNADANVPGEGDITDPRNSFSGRPEMFRWTYQSERFPRLVNSAVNSTALLGKGQLVVAARQDDERRDALIALDTDSGQERWTYAPDARIAQWSADASGIVGYTEVMQDNPDAATQMFVLDAKGQLQKQYALTQGFQPLSNVVKAANGDLVFVTERGIAQLPAADGQARLSIAHPFVRNEHDTVHIQALAP